MKIISFILTFFLTSICWGQKIIELPKVDTTQNSRETIGFLEAKPNMSSDGYFERRYKQVDQVAKTYRISGGKTEGFVQTFYPNGNLRNQVIYSAIGRKSREYVYNRNGILNHFYRKIDSNIFKASGYSSAKGFIYHSMYHVDSNGNEILLYKETEINGYVVYRKCNVNGIQDSLDQNDIMCQIFDTLKVCPDDFYSYFGNDETLKNREFIHLQGFTYRFTLYHENRQVLLTGDLLLDDSKYHWKPIGDWLLKDEFGRVKTVFHKGD